MKTFMRALRWVWPPLSLIAAAIIYVHNLDPSTTPWFLPGVDWLTDGLAVPAGRLSWQGLTAFGAFTLFYAVLLFILERPEHDIAEIGGRGQGMDGKDVKFGDADLDRLVKFESAQKPPDGADDLVKFD